MAITLTKEELLKSVTPTATATPLSTGQDMFSRVSELLNNPAIQQIILRIFNRLMPEPQKPTIPVANPTSNLDADKIYNIIVSTLGSVSANKPDMTVKELLDELEKNKDSIKVVIGNAIKGI